MRRKLLVGALTSLFMFSSVFGQTGAKKQNDKSKLLSAGAHAGWVYSNGKLFNDPNGNSGFEVNKNSNKYAIYAAGLWMGATVNGEVRTSLNGYYSTFVDGTWGSDSKSSIWKLYEISGTEALDPNSIAFKEWMSMKPYGAPVFMDDELGFERPDVKGDQNFWSVFNDDKDHGESGSNPMGAEVNQLIWGYARPDVLGDGAFIKYTISNKSNDIWSDTYLSLWSDPDLGAAGNDFVGCDTVLSLSFVYNGLADADLDTYAAGFDFLQGPVVESPGDSAHYNFGKIGNYKNLPMTSFMTYQNPSGGTGDPNWADPDTKEEIYNYMAGKNKNGGNATSYPGYPAGHSLMFLLTGDPDSKTGWIDANPGDRRLMMTTGPFTMKPGDEQELVLGFVVAQGSDRNKAVTAVKVADDLIQKAYDLNFNLAKPPKAPVLGNTETAGKNYETTYEKDELGAISLTLNWQDGPEDYSVKDEFIKAFNPFFNVNIADTSDSHYEELLDEAKTYKFAGYIVRQYPDASRARGTGRIIAIFDDPINLGINDRFGAPVQTYWSFEVDPSTSSLAYIPKFKTQNRGLAKSIRLTLDLLNDKPFIENTEYYYDVVSFAANPWGAPGVFTSGDAQLITATPKFSDEGITYNAMVGDTIPTTKVGNSDGFVVATVVDPSLLTGADYKVGFKEDATWYLLRTLNNITDTVVNDFKNQPSIGLETDENFPIVDGIKVKVSGAPLDFSDFSVVANASGALADPSGASADYRHFPGLGRKNAAAQQSTNDNFWFVAATGAASTEYSDIKARWTEYSGGYNGAGKHGIGYLVPNDYEMRFTSKGSLALDDFNGSTNRTWVQVPFELWNIGDPSNPADDYQMLAVFLDKDNNGAYNIIPGSDSDISSPATADPYTEEIYWTDPNDKTPGTVGYDAVVALDPNIFPQYVWADQNAYTTHVMRNFILVNFNGDTSSDLPEEGTVFRISTTKPNSPTVSFTFKAPNGPTIPESGEITTLANVKVFPNPFYVHHAKISQRLEKFVYLNNLPKTATIRIINLAGEIVNLINYNEVDNGNKDHTYKYNLNNFDGLPLGSGVYIYHVSAKGMKDKVGKFSVIMPEERLTTY